MDEKMNAALKGIWGSLTDEQKEKAKACKTLDELAKLAGKEGVELPDEVLDAVAGGYIFYDKNYPYHGPNGEDGLWIVVDDQDGHRASNTLFFEKESAISEAKKLGLSTEEIGANKRERLIQNGRISFERFMNQKVC
ncbi:MAG: hypothetical protein E7422_06405 [Ruminococcaceae bacterium]|jgi:hypothetical protein|nr:hypothetical protein [Oscillospiraceae bacterium]